MQFSTFFLISQKIPKIMLVFSNSKVNLGLNVVNKRADGFHNIETVFYPINWSDALEVIENNDPHLSMELTQSGILIDAPSHQNLIYKTWQLICETKKIPPIKVHLHKNVPMGAGLGGGSANAAFFLNMLNSKFELNFTEIEKLKIASKIGSDCAFFVNNRPSFAHGKGNEFEDINLDLSKYYFIIIYPNIISNTKEAYANLKPKPAQHNLKSVIGSKPIEQWKELVVNDFETSIFKKYPLIKQLKELLYFNKAIYASMSGSGSAVFGIFKNKPSFSLPNGYKSYLQMPLIKH